jgi:hypothetical protein
MRCRDQERAFHPISASITAGAAIATLTLK